MSYTYAWSDGATGSTDTVRRRRRRQADHRDRHGHQRRRLGNRHLHTNRHRNRPNSRPTGDTSAPTITGTPQQGDALTAHSGTWSGDTPMSYTYAWSDGATGSTDTLPAGDVGKQITVTVTATNDGGSATAKSASVGPVTASSPPPSGCTTTLAAGSSITAAVNAASSRQHDMSAGRDLFGRHDQRRQLHQHSHRPIRGRHP